MRTLRPLRDQLDMVQRLRGAPVWHLYACWPVINPERDVVGVACISRLLDGAERRQPTYERLATAIGYVQANLGGAIEISDLARGAGVSVSQFERDFVNVMGVSPRRYITKVRIEAAMDMLRGEGAIVEIAHACGYSDQSAFTRRFRASVGLSPSEYRRNYATT